MSLRTLLSIGCGNLLDMWHNQQDCRAALAMTHFRHSREGGNPVLYK